MRFKVAEFAYKKESKMTIASIGIGAMGGAIIDAICKAKQAGSLDELEQIRVSSRNPVHAQDFSQKDAHNTLCVALSSKQAVEGADVVFLAVKPKDLDAVVTQIKDALKSNSIIVSMAACVPLSHLLQLLDRKDLQVARIMPNVASTVSKGATALCFSDTASPASKKIVATLLAACGQVIPLDEKLFDAFTYCSASGIAIVFELIESMADAAVLLGIPRKDAYKIVAQTVEGAAAMVATGGDENHPAVLKDKVCSPSGTTIRGLRALEKGGLRSSVIEAICAMAKV